MGSGRVGVDRPASLADAGPRLEERKLSARKAAVVNELVAHRAPRPAAAKHCFVAIESLLAHFAMTRLDRKQHRLPVAASFSDAHGPAV